MKNQKAISLFTLLLLMCSSCSDKKNGAEQIILTNHTTVERIDEAFVITREQLSPGNSNLLPALKNEQGEWIATQVDDLDKDGNWDELAFVYNLQPGATATLQIEWVTPESYPTFTSRTNVRYGKMTSPGNIEILETDCHGKENLARGVGYPYQTDGPAWENDKVGFRHYFDGRNIRDVFGKTTDQMVMDSVGIREDGTPGDTYHVLAWWGRDIMSGARSIGLGGIGLNTPDSLIRLGVPIEETTDNIESTCFTRIVNGPVRSIFYLDFYGWDIYGEKIDVHEVVTIWAGKFGHENLITTSRLPEGTNLFTGIVNNFNDEPYTQEKIGKYEMMSTHDMQTYDKVWYMGMSLLIEEDNWNGTFEAPETGKGITTTWCANLKPNKDGEYRYNCYAAWEITDENFRDREFYLQLIRSYAAELSEKIIPVVK